MPIPVCSFSSYRFTFCVCRPEKQSAGKTLHVWCRWTDRIWFLTQREWSAGSATWSLSLVRVSCSESVSTASASKEESECAAVAYIQWHLLFCIVMQYLRKLSVFLWVESVCALWFWCQRTLRWHVHTETRPTPATASCKKEKSELWELSFILFIFLIIYTFNLPLCLQNYTAVGYFWQDPCTLIRSVCQTVCRSLTLQLRHCPWCWSIIDRRPGAMLIWKAFNDSSIG